MTNHDNSPVISIYSGNYEPLKEFLEKQYDKVEVVAPIHQCAVQLECRCVICVEGVVDKLG